VTEVPLAEDFDAYKIDILDGTAVKRTQITSSSSVVYTAAQLVTDFGATQPTIALRVAQLSATRGRGTTRAATV
jgi:hypothetical protein